MPSSSSFRTALFLLRSLFLSAVLFSTTLLFAARLSNAQTFVLTDLTTITNGFLPLNQTTAGGPPGTLLDWATSDGGEIVSFTLGYATDLTTVDLCVIFYTSTSDGGNGTEIARYDFTGLPGSGSGNFEIVTHTVDISGTPFTLPAGPFGYAYEVKDDRTGPLTVSAGTGTTDFYRVFPALTNQVIDGFYAQLYLRLTALVPPPPPSGLWYVDNSVAGPGDGSEANPFPTLLQAETAAGEDETIIVRNGAGPYAEGFTLKRGQTLMGGPDDPPQVRGIMLGTDTHVIGIHSIDSDGPGIQAQGINLGNSTIDDTAVSNSNGQGIWLNNSTGTLTISTTDLSGTGGVGIMMQGGSPSVSFNGTITMPLEDDAPPAVHLQSPSDCDFRVVEGSTISTRVMVFDDVSLCNVEFIGNTNLESGGIDILSSSGTFTFSNTTITNPTGSAINIEGGSADVTFNGSAVISSDSPIPALAVQDHSGGTFVYEGTLEADGRPGLGFNNADGVYNFDGEISLNGGERGIDIIGDSHGTFTFSNTTITEPTGPAIRIEDGGPDVDFTGTIFPKSDSTAIILRRLREATVKAKGGLTDSTGGSLIEISESEGTFDLDMPIFSGGTGNDGLFPSIAVRKSSGTIRFGSICITNTGAKSVAELSFEEVTNAFLDIKNLKLDDLPDTAIELTQAQNTKINIDSLLARGGKTGVRVEKADSVDITLGHVELTDVDQNFHVSDVDRLKFFVSSYSATNSGPPIENESLGFFEFAVGEATFQNVQISSPPDRSVFDVQNSEMTFTLDNAIFDGGDHAMHATGSSLEMQMDNTTIQNTSEAAFQYQQMTYVSHDMKGSSILNVPQGISITDTEEASVTLESVEIESPQALSVTNVGVWISDVSNSSLHQTLANPIPPDFFGVTAGNMEEGFPPTDTPVFRINNTDIHADPGSRALEITLLNLESEAPLQVELDNVNVFGGKNAIQVQGNGVVLSLTGSTFEETEEDAIVVTDIEEARLISTLLQNIGGNGVTMKNVRVVTMGELLMENIGGSGFVRLPNRLVAAPKTQALQTLSLDGSTITGTGSTAVDIGVGEGEALALSAINNTVSTTTPYGFAIATEGTGTALATLTDNTVSASTAAFFLSQTGRSGLSLVGFEGGDADAVAAFLQSINDGTPGVEVIGTVSAGPAANAVDMRLIDKAVSSETPAAGDVVSYTLRITNAGPTDATQVMVSDVLPTGLAFIPGSLTVNGTTMTDAGDGDLADFGETQAGAVTVLSPMMAVDDTLVVTFDTQVDEQAAGSSIQNLAQVAAAEPEAFSNNNTAEVTIDVMLPTDTEEAILPSSLSLSPGYPNPFHQHTTLTFTLPQASHVLLEIFDVSGRRVRSLQQERLSAGIHQVRWDGLNMQQRPVPSGLYLVRLQTEETALQSSVVRIR